MFCVAAKRKTTFISVVRFAGDIFYFTKNQGDKLMKIRKTIFSLLLAISATLALGVFIVDFSFFLAEINWIFLPRKKIFYFF